MRFIYNSATKKIFKLATATFLLLATIFAQTGVVQAATYTFTQGNWGGGATANTTVHNPVNGVTTGWTEYSAKDSGVSAVSGGNDLELALVAASTTHTTDTHFNAGTKTQTVIAGSGSGASVQVASNAIAAVAGNSHAFVLKSDGTVWGWGLNTSGQLGDASSANRYAPVQITSLSGVTAIAAGTNHSLFLKSDGTVWGTGLNTTGQLGDGTTTGRYAPVQTTGLTNVTAIAANGNVSLAVKSDGTVWAWGQNTNGQLGDGTTVNKSVPTQVSGLTGVIAVANGTIHSLALKSDGTVWAWGQGTSGQIGDGTALQRLTPVQVTGLTGVSSIGAGITHSLALKSDGTVWAWGSNSYGQLGDGTTTQRNAPIQVPGLTGVTAVSKGGNSNSSFVVKSDGTAWSAGYNGYGELGKNSLAGATTPFAQATGFGSGVTAIGLGGYFSLAVKNDGSVWSVGTGNVGQLGDDTVGDKVIASKVVGAASAPLALKPSTSATSATVAAGSTHSLGVKSDGTVWVWGANNNGQLGDGSTTRRLTPSQLASISGVAAVAAGQSFSLALKSDGTVWAWGIGSSGQLGDGTATQRNSPVQVSGLTGVVAIGAGNVSSYAVKSDGTVWAWGGNIYGQLGDNSTINRSTPVQVSGLTGVVAVVGGESHTLFLKSDGTVWGAGLNNFGQLGDGTTTQRNIAVQATGLTGVIGVAAGRQHSIILKSDGTVWTFGNSQYSQIGDGTTTHRYVATQVPGLTGVSFVSAGYEHSIAVKSDGTVWTWGRNNYGQLGDNSVTTRSTPVQAVGTTGFRSLAFGPSANHTLALKTNGEMWGWGDNTNNALGNNYTITVRAYPVQSFTWNFPTDYFSVGLPYAASGTFVSQTIDTTVTSNFNTISYTASTPAGTGVTIDVRAGNTSSPDASWTAWQTGIANGGSISVLNGNRYMRYRLNLTSTGSATPQVSDVTVTHSAYPAVATLTSSPFNSSDTANILSQIQWTSSVPANTELKFQIRSSADNVTWSGWMGPNGTSTSYFTDPTGGEAMPAALTSGSGAKWFQYKVFLLSNGAVTPNLSDVSVVYVVNAPPEFDAVATTTAAQVTNSADADWGKVRITYNVRDTDTMTGSFTPGFVTPSFEYNIGGGWIAIATSSLAAGDTEGKAVNEAAYTQHIATWDAKSQIPNTDVANAQVRVTITDSEPANATAQATTGSFVLDTANPTATTQQSDAANGIVAYQAGDSSNISYRLSNNSDLSPDGINANSGIWVDAGTNAVNASTTWTFTGDPSYQAIYFQVRDIYGNTVTSANVIPMRPSNFDIKDTSNLATNDFREFLSWKAYVSTSTATFSRYEVWRSANNDTFSLYDTVNGLCDGCNPNSPGNPGLNYYTDAVVASSTIYTYKIRVVDTDGDLSPWATNVPSDMPDGQGGSDFTPPTISSIAMPEQQSTWAKVTFSTDEATFGSAVYKKADGSGQTTAEDSSLGTDHAVVLSNLLPNTDYLYKVVARDILNNESSNDNGGAWYAFTTRSGPVISNVTAVLTDDRSATIVWNTDIDANSTVVYASSINDLANASNTTSVVDATFVGGPPYQHRLTLTELSPRTTYWYYVSSTDASGDVAIDKNNLSFYTFTTSYDQKSPVLSDISVPVAAPTGLVVYWRTDELANSTLLVGTASSTYNTTITDGVMSITHALSMTGLTPDTMYHYQVRSCDPGGNCAESIDMAVATPKDGEVKIVTIGGGSGAGQFSEAPTPKDTTAPTITSIQVATTTAFGATITFDTSEPTIAFLEYGKDTNYGGVTGSKSFATHHEVALSGLRIGTDYHYQAKVFDRAANEVASADQTFKTKFVTDAGEDLRTIEDIRAYEQLSEDAIEAILPSIRPPFIEEPRVVETTENTATIRWRTNINAYAGVLYAEEGEYNATTTSPYTEELTQVTVKEKEHTMTLAGLKPNTTYHFMARSFSIPEVIGSSKDMTFVTKAPKVSASIIDVKNTSFRVIWTTDQLASTIVEYRNVKTGTTERIIEDKPVTYHDILVDKATPGTSYEVRVFGYGANGNLIESGAVLTVLTSRDVSAPKISNFKVDGALVPGRTDRVQTVITWTTDEPSNSAVFFQEGAGAVKDFANKDEELDTYTTNHAIILSNLKPGTIYQMKLESVDQAGNKASFGPRTIITPQKGESIFDVIFKNFEDTFKFLRGAGQ